MTTAVRLQFEAGRRVREWVAETAALCRPAAVRWLDGSQAEYEDLCRILVAAGTFIPLDPVKRPHSYLCRSHPDDVARVEDRTFICAATPEAAGFTNNWAEPRQMKQTLRGLFAGAMAGRTMYVVPFSMGPIGAPGSRIGVQITDSAYAAVSMRIMTRVGRQVLDRLGDDQFVPCLHSVGSPLSPGQADRPWPCDATRKYIAHFPETREVWSYGSGYGGNALLGKKCFALRIASVLARDQGWMAEHMLILGLTSPAGDTRYIAAAFPSACGKTNLAMMRSALPGWSVRCVGDDIAWLRIGADGRLRAINPEAGFFGVAPYTSWASNPNAMATIASHSLFTNVALTPDGDVWWEGMTETPPPHLTDWTGQAWTPGCGRKAAHPNARYTTPAHRCPVIDPAWEDPEGVPISAIVFGGRRMTTVPLVNEARSWEHGVFLGSTCSSETTAAASGTVGTVRHDPFAMLPFCGYHMGDYVQHWLDMGQRMDPVLRPRIFYVNWFRKHEQGGWLWPGFGENVRVLKWISERLAGSAGAIDTPIGLLPTAQALDCSGLALAPGALDQLLRVDVDGWRRESERIASFYARFGDRLPRGLQAQLDDLRQRLAQARPATG